MPKIEIPINELRKNKIFLAVPMYGGQCAGVFAKSVADFSAKCVHYGIQLQMYFLFNESLIPRARNYCCDEFMRSDATHMMFIDSDIGFNPDDVIALLALQRDDSPYDIIGGPYPKKCLPSTTKIHTEDGVKTIAAIVEEKYTGQVMSLNRNNQVVWKKVTNHWSEPNKIGKKWVGLSTATWSKDSSITPRSKVIATSDHDVAYIYNPLEPAISYAPASQLLGRYLVQTVKSSDNVKDSSVRYPLLPKDRLSVLIGGALGDGCVSQGIYIANHCPQQEEYNRFKWNVIGGRFNAGTINNTHHFVNGQTQYLSDMIYDENGKTLRNVVNYIDEIALTIMYLDDGNRYYYPETPTEETNQYTWWYNSNGDTVRCEQSPGDDWKRGRRADAWRATASIATMAFSHDDNVLLVEHIKKAFDIDCYVQGTEGKYQIKFDKDNTDKLHKLIAKYVPSCMEYKINPEYRGSVKYTFDSPMLEIAATKIRDIVDVNIDSHLYDIEIEDTHNFFVNDGVLVHNCISWEKVKMAVDKGFADENPNALEAFVGDYVFNPKGGTQSIPIGEPAEVLEIGTGFMMIRRKTFEVFNEKFPQYSYKPDHVRTEHFDGSREIMMYFQAEIDPVSKRYLSEDYWFCQRVQEAGLRTWLCPWMKLQHVGSMIFGGSLADIAALGASATACPDQLKKK